MRSSPSAPPRLAVLLAFAAIYLLWGSCFLAIRIAVERLPPLLMGGSRFLFAGILLYAALRWRGAPRPSLSDLSASTTLGVCYIVVGNGVTAWVANRVASSYSALIWSSVPLWMVILQSAWPKEPAGSARAKAGALIGFIGMALLVWPARGAEGPAMLPTVLLLAATAAWSFASLKARTPRPTLSPFMATALQMATGGTLLLALGAAGGELRVLALDELSFRSASAFLYLMLPGSLIPLTAYAWLLQHVAASKVATFAYVNPLVAVVLGVGLAGEALTSSMVLGGAVILFGVFLTLVERRHEGGDLDARGVRGTVAQDS